MGLKEHSEGLHSEASEFHIDIVDSIAFLWDPWIKHVRTEMMIRHTENHLLERRILSVIGTV